MVLMVVHEWSVQLKFPLASWLNANTTIELTWKQINTKYVWTYKEFAVVFSCINTE